MSKFLKTLAATSAALTALGLASAFAAPYHHRDAPYRQGGATERTRIIDTPGPGYRVVNTERYNTRYRAKIFVRTEIDRGPRHRYRGWRYARYYAPRATCTIAVRGPEARYVPQRRLERIARRECPARARIEIRY